MYLGHFSSQFLPGPCLSVSPSEHRPGRDLPLSLPSFSLPHPKSPHAQVPGTWPMMGPCPFSPPKTPAAPWFCFYSAVTYPLCLLKSSFLIVALNSLPFRSWTASPASSPTPPVHTPLLHTSIYLTFPRHFSLSLPWLCSAFNVLFTVLDLWTFYYFLKLCRVLTAIPL